MKKAYYQHQKYTMNLSSTIDYMKVDLQNQIQTNLNFNYHNMLLR